MAKRKTFSGEFKLAVGEDIRENWISYREAIRKYGIGGKMSIQKRERIYLEEGIQGLNIERRGRGSPGRPLKLAK